MNTPEVIQRNFFRLLRCGAFGEKEPIEPLSAWKWKRIHQLSLMHGVGAIVADGIKMCEDDFFMQLPDGQSGAWLSTTRKTEEYNAEINTRLAELLDMFNRSHLRPMLFKGQSLAGIYGTPEHRTATDIDIYFPYEAQAEKADAWARDNGSDIDESDSYILKYKWNGIKVEHHRQIQHLTNKFLNRKLQSFIGNETKCCDSSYTTINGVKIETVSPTLCLLLIMIRIAKYIMNEGISMKQLVDLGMFIRKSGDKVDFVKLQKWLSSLQMQFMAQLEGALLIDLLRFDEDEIPFLNAKGDRNTDETTSDIFRINGSHTGEWFFTQGKHVFVRTSDSSAMIWHLRHSARYFRYWPMESFTNFFTSFAHSLAHIEE